MAETQPWVDGLSIGQALRRRAAEQPDSEALVSQTESRVSYALAATT